MRKLNGFYAIEVLNGRLNGSSSQVETNNSAFKAATFTKKVNGRSKISAQCQKFNIKDHVSTMIGVEQAEKIKDGKQIKAVLDPYASEIDDIFGFMIATKTEITEEQYEQLDEAKQKLFKKSKKMYQANLTKKRRARLQMNALINVSSRKVNWDWYVASSSTDSIPYQQEVYSGVHTAIFNLDIDKVGKFTISDEPSEYRDYSTEEAQLSGVKDLTKEERYKRVDHVLTAIEHLAISSNQANHLTDTKPKFVILADYKWGNNAFQGVLKEGYLDIDMLKECISQNELYRVSNIYIGVNRFFDDRYNDMTKELEEMFGEVDYVKISNVQDAFKGYKAELEKNIED